jgi:hypothetical protein
MLDTLQGLSLLTLVEIIGPIVLAAAIVYGIYHSRRQRRTRACQESGTIYAQDR